MMMIPFFMPSGGSAGGPEGFIGMALSMVAGATVIAFGFHILGVDPHELLSKKWWAIPAGMALLLAYCGFCVWAAMAADDWAERRWQAKHKEH